MNMITASQSSGLTAIEGFCGAGGMSLGLMQAGFDVRLAFDIDPQAVATYKSGVAAHAHVLDASKVTGSELLHKAGLTRRLDLFSGGPPCQGFSKQKRGAHLLEDARNGLVLEHARLVLELNPRAFLFENVEIFGQKRGGELISEIKDRLGIYRIYTFFVCSSDFGLAQRRGRFMMIGLHADEVENVPVLELVGQRYTIQDVIGDLPTPPDNYSEHPDYANHIKCKITALNEERFSYVPPGGGWRDIPRHLQLTCHQAVDTDSGGWPDVYGRLEWNGQCPTITAGFDSFTRGRYGHPEQNRSLTLREGARLQGFPDAVRFYGTRHDVRLQIGNAVPPPVAKAAGDSIARCLTGCGISTSRVQWPEEGKRYNNQMSLQT